MSEVCFQCPRENRNGMIQGAAIAAAIVAKGDYGDGLVAEILNAFAADWRTLKAAGVDDYDLKILKKYLKGSGKFVRQMTHREAPGRSEE